jgi:hypothetical protein
LIVPVTTDSLRQKAPRPLRAVKTAKLERLVGAKRWRSTTRSRLDEQRRAEVAGAS